MINHFVYQYTLSDGSSGIWITEIPPRFAGYDLPKRFPWRSVVSIKRIN